MRTTTTGIARLFGWMLLAGSLLVASCSSEEEQKKGGNPDEPGGESGDRREVVLTLKNKLVLASATKGSNGTQSSGAQPGTKAAGTKAISTAAENVIRTLDVYVFGSDTEDGEYTYQERFAYRADDNDELPTGANELQLAVQGANGDEATGLLKLKRGLFVKLYCIANDVSLIDPAGDGVTPVQPSDFKPLTLTAPGETGTTVATPGVPLESSFVGYHTHLLTATAEGDTLSCPLAMSGALTTALDLTSFDNSARLQAGFKLTRLAARFDIQNVSTDSRFTLQSVSMGNGRCGSGYFPIRVYGDLPTAQPDELITYPARTFYGADANKGLCVSAFYTYPSPQADKGYLILKGLYKVNETENKEVSYQIPFRQMTPNGQEMYLDINHNHRYTLAITAADAYHLDANITVADWADDGSIEYTPENTPGEIIVTIPPAFTGETTYNEETKTVSMPVKTGSTFDMTITTNSALKVSKVYAGGAAGQLQNWLTISDPAITPGTAFSTYKYTVSLNASYGLSRYPRATLRLTNVIDGSESLLFVEPVAAPLPIETPQPPKAPNGKSDNPNTFDPENNAASLYRITGSQAQVKINCPDGIEVDTKPDWLDVAVSTQVGAITTATLTLNDRDAVVSGNQGVVAFRNKKKTELGITVNVTLLDAPVVPDYAGISGDNQFTPAVPGVTPADVSLAIKAGNAVTVKTTSLDGVSIQMAYPDGSPEWLSFEGASAAVTKATTMNSTQDLVFRPIASKLAGAQQATVTLVNIIGGTNDSFTITPAMQPGSAVESPVVPSVPLQSQLKNKAITLYQLPGEKAAASQMTLDVTSMGGSKLAYEAAEGGTGITLSPTENTANASAYVLKPALADGTDKATGTLHVKNYTDPSKVVDYAVTVLRSNLTGQTAMSLNAAKDRTANVTVSSFEGFTIDPASIDWKGGDSWFRISSATDNAAGSNVKVTATATATGAMVNIRPATITLVNKIKDGGDLQVTVTPVFEAPTLNPASGTIGVYLNTAETATFTASAAGGITDATSSNPGVATVSRNAGTFTVTAVKDGSADIPVANNSDTGTKSTYKVTVASKTYNGKAVWKYYGFYIAPEDAGPSTWRDNLTDIFCKNKSGASWYVPTDAEWRTILQTSGGNAPANVFNEYKDRGVFEVDTDYWSSTPFASTRAYSLSFYSSNASVRNYGIQSNLFQVRCVAK